jgi:NTP pyrophosphatase (non-canonical NTP hydrolase)
MTTEFFEKYLANIATKYNLHAVNEAEWNDRKKYTNGLIDEVKEVEQEVKDSNAVYLEDELGDILWDYMNLLHVLHQDGKIDSIESVFQRSLKKYGQRIDAIDIDGNIDLKVSNWDIIKKQQKNENKEEHEKRYGNELFTVEPIVDPYTLPFAPWLIQQIKEKSKWKTYRFGSKYDYLNI